MKAEDVRVLALMTKYGGSFVSALANAAKYADEENLRRIKEAFQEYWEEYSELDKQLNTPPNR